MLVHMGSYCRYSRKAKDILARYDLSPPPKIIEVDLRGTSSSPSRSFLAAQKRRRRGLTWTLNVPWPLSDDGDFIKAVLTRLTRRSTFPNVILRGKSIGGADDISAMHRDGHLRQVFEKAGFNVRGELRGEDAT